LRRLHFSAPPGANSFYYAATYARAYVDPSRVNVTVGPGVLVGAVNVRVNDLWREIMRPSRAPVWWVDTPLDYEGVVDVRRPRWLHDVWVPSKYNLEVCDRVLGGCRLVRRPVHPVYTIVEPREEPAYDMAFVGKCWWRKRCREFLHTCNELGLKCWGTFDYNTMTLQELASRLADTKMLWWMTGGEGYGMPMLEAQLVGAIPVYINAGAMAELTVVDIGAVEAIESRIVESPEGRHRVFYYDSQDLNRAIEYVLDGYRSGWIHRYRRVMREGALAILRSAVYEMNANLYRLYNIIY